MTLRSRNSDAWHRCNDSIFFDDFAEGPLEGVQVHAASLLHNLADPRLALLQGFQSVVFGAELLVANSDTAGPEIDLGHRILALGVILAVDLPQYLQVSQAVVALLLRCLGKVSHVFLHPSVLSNAASI